MFMARSLLPPDAAVRGDPHDLEAIRCELSRRGWPTKLARVPICGEDDVRLLVGALGPLVVELLGPFAGSACGDRWQAVRVCPESRVVWCGPPRSSPLAQVIEFIEDLLRCDTEPLAARYRKLG